jgi:hypothetical protein
MVTDVCSDWSRDLKKGEEITYNYQLDDCEGLFGRQVCMLRDHAHMTDAALLMMTRDAMMSRILSDSRSAHAHFNSHSLH